jgi:hypothetical protein
VGKVGPGSNPRFQNHHYGSNAPSTLAKAIANNPILWPYIGYSADIQNIGEWIRKNLDRDSFFVSSCDDHNNLIALLEVFVKARLGPIYEGSLGSK